MRTEMDFLVLETCVLDKKGPTSHAGHRKTGRRNSLTNPYGQAPKPRQRAKLTEVALSVPDSRFPAIDKPNENQRR
jgi:hypothetical protein